MVVYTVYASPSTSDGGGTYLEVRHPLSEGGAIVPKDGDIFAHAKDLVRYSEPRAKRYGVRVVAVRYERVETVIAEGRETGNEPEEVNEPN
jgi:hypothetical protein